MQTKLILENHARKLQNNCMSQRPFRITKFVKRFFIILNKCNSQLVKNLLFIAKETEYLSPALIETLIYRHVGSSLKSTPTVVIELFKYFSSYCISVLFPSVDSCF